VRGPRSRGGRPRPPCRVRPARRQAYRLSRATRRDIARGAGRHATLRQRCKRPCGSGARVAPCSVRSAPVVPRSTPEYPPRGVGNGATARLFGGGARPWAAMLYGACGISGVRCTLYLYTYVCVCV
jgi:hypothetical protein